jgi:hypothetical protein
MAMVPTRLPAVTASSAVTRKPGEDDVAVAGTLPEMLAVT